MHCAVLAGDYILPGQFLVKFKITADSYDYPGCEIAWNVA